MKAFRFVFLVYSVLALNVAIAGEHQQKLPRLSLGTSSFAKIRENERIYVDKTEHILRILQSNKRYYFLARPRQSGKRLLLSTLKEIFTGHKDLFKNLKITQSDYSWQVSPVVNLNFFCTPISNAQAFEEGLGRNIHEIAQEQGVVTNRSASFVDQLKILLDELGIRYGKQSVVLLVDEYDLPLRRQMDNKEEYFKVEALLKKLFDVIGQYDCCWRFVCVTGLTKCSKQIIFSGVSGLYDISEKEEGVSLCGFSKEETRLYLGEHLQAYSALTLECALDLLMSKYKGLTSVMHPRSVLDYLDKQCNLYTS